MVIVSAFGFLFLISYRHFKLWPELKFEITFDFTEKKFFFVRSKILTGEKNYLSIYSHMIRPICCLLCISVHMYTMSFLTFQTPESALYWEETDRQKHIYKMDVVVSRSGHCSGLISICWEVIDDTIAALWINIYNSIFDVEKNYS